MFSQGEKPDFFETLEILSKKPHPLEYIEYKLGVRFFVENEEIYVDFLNNQQQILPPDTYYFLYSSFKDILLRWELIWDNGSFLARSRTNKIYGMAIEPEENQSIYHRQLLQKSVKKFLKIMKRFQIARKETQPIEIFQLLYPELSKTNMMKIVIIFIESTLEKHKYLNLFFRQTQEEINLSQFAFNHGISFPIDFDNDHIRNYVKEDLETQTGWKTEVITTRISPLTTQHEYPIDSFIKILPLKVKREILEFLLPLVNWKNRAYDPEKEKITSLFCDINTNSQQKRGY